MPQFDIVRLYFYLYCNQNITLLVISSTHTHTHRGTTLSFRQPLQISTPLCPIVFLNLTTWFLLQALIMVMGVMWVKSKNHYASFRLVAGGW